MLLTNAVHNVSAGIGGVFKISSLSLLLRCCSKSIPLPFLLPPTVTISFNTNREALQNYTITKRYFIATPSNSSGKKDAQKPGMRGLAGKVAIVTASTDGIGFAIAKRLAEEGAKVVISSRKEANVERAVNELKKSGLDVYGLTCHVGKSEDRKRLFEKTIEHYKRLNILVSNAAVNPSVGPALESDEAIWDKIFDINVKCSYLLAKEALPHLRKETGSSVTFVSSIGGYDPFSLLGVYSVSKTTLIGLTKAAAKDLGPEGIRVNCIAPGVIRTKFSKALYEDPLSHEAILQQVPLKRLGESDEIGAIAAFLASDDASYITGETIVASGGMTSRL